MKLSTLFLGGCILAGSGAIALPRLFTSTVAKVGATISQAGEGLENARLANVREGAAATASAVAESLAPSFERQAVATDRQAQSIDAVSAAIARAAADSNARPVEVRVVLAPSDDRRSTYTYRR